MRVRNYQIRTLYSSSDIKITQTTNYKSSKRGQGRQILVTSWNGSDSVVHRIQCFDWMVLEYEYNVRIW